MTRIMRINRDRADPAWNFRLRGRGEQRPRLPAVGCPVNSHAGIRIRREVRLAGAAIDDLRIRRMNRERADVQHVLRMPESFPTPPRIRALPDASASRARPDIVRLRRIANQTRDSSAHIRRPDAFPLRVSRRRCEFLLSPGAFADELTYARLPQRPRRSRLKPNASSFMIPRDPPEL